MIIQPQRFFVEQPTHNLTQWVYASYDELIQQSKQQNGSLSFDTVAVDDDGKTTITYKVVAWDTLSSIAQDFGTTVQTLVEKNGLDPQKTLRKWQELIISFTENFVYQIQEDSTLEQFAKQYDLNIDDLMNLNYLTPPSVKISVGQELILPLTRAEAKAKGLVNVEEFVPLEIISDSIDEEQIEEVDPSEPTETPKEWSVWIDDSNQEIITPEQTEQHLKSIEEQTQQQQRAYEEQRIAKEKSEKEKAEQAKKQKEIEKIKQQTPTTKPKNNACNENQCLHDNKCYSKPQNAVCAPQDPGNAWVCKAWFVDTWKSCVKQSTAKTTTTKTGQKKVNKWVLNQWYFNAKKTGYPYNGRARGHCTEYVDYRRWKNLWKRTYWRGNANRWYKSAAAAGASVGKTPKYGAAAVFAAWTNSYRGYGHVWVVIDIDRENNLILIEEQNYVGTYVVNQRRVNMNQPIGYVYPG